MVININNQQEIDNNKSDSYIIDTNILSCLFVSNQQWSSQKKSAYTNFILDLMQKNTSLYVSTLSLQELFHVTERIAYEQYCRTNNKNKRQYTLKCFRSDNAERTKLANSLKQIHSMIVNQYQIIEEYITKGDVQDFVKTYSNHVYDPMDYLVVSHNLERCNNIITDDKDFQKDNRLNIFTYIP